MHLIYKKKKKHTEKEYENEQLTFSFRKSLFNYEQ